MSDLALDLPSTLASSSSPSPSPLSSSSSSSVSTSSTSTSASSHDSTATSTSTSTSSNNNDIKAALTEALQTWKAIDLDGRRSEIDNQALAIFDDQQRSLTTRKQLVEQTKSLRSMSDAMKLSSLGGVLKAYQEEINQLTRRAKFAESAFTSLYKALYEAQDPTHFMTRQLADLSTLSTLNAELSRCRSLLASYDVEFASLKNQEYTIRVLEAENREHEKTMQARISALLADSELRMNEEARAMRQRMLDQERMAQAKISQAREQLSRALAQHQATQQELFMQNQKRENVEDARDTAAELVASELEAAKSTITSLKQEISVLRSSLRSNASASSSIGGSQHPHLRSVTLEATSLTGATFAELESEISDLRAQLDGSDANHRDAVQRLESECATLRSECARVHAQLDVASKKVTNLMSELETRPTMMEHDAVKKQLQLLQEIEYNYVDVSENENVSESEGERSGSVTGSNGESNSGSSSSSSLSRARSKVEQMLINKNRRLEADLTATKVSLSDSRSLVSRLQTEQLEHLRELSEQKALIQRLEQDLESAQIASSSSSSSPSSTTAAVTTSANSAHKRSDSLIDFPSDSSDSSSSSSSSSSVLSAPSMLSIIVHQRDRFRCRVEALERDKYDMQLHSDGLVKQINALKHDNIKLYEKLQYVRSFQNKRDHRESVLDIDDANSDLNYSSSSSSSSSSVESRYALLYESSSSSSSPFVLFKSAEQADRLNALSFTEKITLSAAKCLFGRKLFRNFLFAYSLLLHILVAIVLYTHTVAPHCHR